MDFTKKIVISFITISFVYIIGYGCFFSTNINEVNQDNKTIATVDKNENSDISSEDKNHGIEEQNEKTQNTKKTTTSKKSETTSTSQNKKQKDDSKQTQSTQKQESKTTKKVDKGVTNKKSDNQTNNSSKKTEISKTQPNKQEENQTKENQVVEEPVEQSNTQDKTNDNESQINVNITIKGLKSQTLADGQISVKEKSSVYDVLKNFTTQKNINLEAKDSIYGTYVVAIADLREKEHGGGSGWVYYVNGNYANRSCDAYKVKNGDNIVWKYVSNE